MPDRYTLRHPAPADLEAVQALLDAVESTDAGEPRKHEFDTTVAFQDSRMALATNTWLVEAPNGEFAAFAFLFWGDSAQGEAEPFVHPGHRGRGLGDALLDVLEARAAELASSAASDADPRLHVVCEQSKQRRRAALVERGYRVVREFYLMRIDLADTPVRPSPPPAGVELRPFTADGDEEAVYAADEEAFADHFLFESSTIQQWRTHTVELSAFDPSLWLIAWDGEEVAGEALTLALEGEALVDSLAVRRRWRSRGLGLSLLTRSFALAHERGHRKIRLGVDAQNASGALGLYLKAGMRVERRFEVHARDLR